MAKIEKIFKEWEKEKPEFPLNDVLYVLEKYGFNIERKIGSHIVVRHQYLIGLGKHGEDGHYTIATKHGKTVKRCYIKEIIKMLNIIKEMKSL